MLQHFHHMSMVVPHITDAVQKWVTDVALKPVSDRNVVPEVCIIEPNTTGESKTKPTQESVRKLLKLGLSPDLIICRSELPISEDVKQKISGFCNVAPGQVVGLHDAPSVYHIPVVMEALGLFRFFRDCLHLPEIQDLCNSRRHFRQWKHLVRKIDSITREVKIALVGKYTSLRDAYASVTNALQHASLYCNYKLNLKFIAATDLERTTYEQDRLRYDQAWQNLWKADGVIVPSGFGTAGCDGKIAAIEWARKNKKPFLGICLGFQLTVVEFARHVVGWKDAHTIEVTQDKSKKNVVIEMPEHHTGIKGGTMRLGKKITSFNTLDSILSRLYGDRDFIEERHRRRYEVNKEFVPDLVQAGLRFVAQDEESKERLEILELSMADHPYFVAVQFHPECLSRPLKPSPPYLGLILASTGDLKPYLSNGCQLLSSDPDGDSSEDESETPESKSCSS